MLGTPAQGPNMGAWTYDGPLPQDVVGAVVGQLRTSMLDLGTALRLGGTGRRRYFGTVLPSPQVFVAPSTPNSVDNLRAGLKGSGNARRTLGKNSSRGLRGMPGTVI